ncbi:carboxymuconolactone decarboxylase family protein [Lipingzhangella sp. LS1_29]|uniref:Carboxymuconolactone decarboxylase family protein n=1 Tax=Lipingzhangella rawalii TaxID=2055835 RepID=A0ABU2H9A0_9ACTN|nr:carboxymuconolactone decarboxylase family protein [Lipingzhangella rawalii]MDS1271861.1 carboxymuconolactone decarboxylase family protein [Lipingzhangella rawalii]
MMARIPVHSTDDAPEGAREHLKQLEAHLGTVLNIHGEMAHAPVLLAAYTGIQQAITTHGTFEARTREAIALAVGAVNDCAYCQSAHTGMARQVGWSTDETIAIRNGEHLPQNESLTVLLRVARDIAEAGGEVRDDTWQQAVDAGWTTTELTELYAHVVVNLFTNYFNHYARTDLDLPPAPGLESHHT